MGMFIVFEGLDGCGKTTASKKFYDYLKSRNVDCMWTREPGGSKVAEELRKIILSKDYDIDTETEILMFTAARCHHLAHTIKPALDRGAVVICDRFYDSTLVYQSDSIEDMWKLQEWTLNFDWMIEPDVTFYLRVDPTVALSRLSSRNGIDGNDRIEDSSRERIYKMFSMYEELSKNIGNYTCIDAEQDENSVLTSIIEKAIKIHKVTT